MSLNAQWIAGFIDGEGCFSVTINKNHSMKQKLQVLPEFVVVQHKSDKKILEQLKEYFKCGVVRTNHRDRLCFRVRKIQDLKDVIIPFFDLYPCKQTNKKE